MLLNALSRGEHFVLGISGYVVPGQQLARERLARFQARQAFRRADTGNPQRFQRIHDALRQRFLGPDNHEIRPLLARRTEDLFPGLSALPFSEAQKRSCNPRAFEQTSLNRAGPAVFSDYRRFQVALLHSNKTTRFFCITALDPDSAKS